MENEELNSRGSMNEAVRDYNMALADVKKRTETMTRLQQMEDAAGECPVRFVRFGVVCARAGDAAYRWRSQTCLRRAPLAVCSSTMFGVSGC